MARQIDTSQGMDAKNAATLSGNAPRGRVNIRENEQRVKRRGKDKDVFYIPPEMIPKGYVVEWKRRSVMGKPEGFEYEMDLADAGWKIASPTTFPQMVPEGYEGKTIERKGLILMIRPKHLKDEARAAERDEALGQVRDKLQEIGFTGQDEAPRVVSIFNRGYDRTGRMIPEDDGEFGAAEPISEGGYEEGGGRAGNE